MGKSNFVLETVSYETTVILEEKSEGVLCWQSSYKGAAIKPRTEQRRQNRKQDSPKLHPLWIFKTCFQTLDETLDVVVGCSPVAIVIRTQYFKENPTVCPL